MLTVPPYPFVLEDPSGVPLEECWVARSELFFTCHLRPTDGRQPKARHTYGEVRDDDSRVALVFYSTFEKLGLTCSGPMEKRMCNSITSPHQRPPSTWAQSPMCRVACP